MGCVGEVGAESLELVDRWYVRRLDVREGGEGISGSVDGGSRVLAAQTLRARSREQRDPEHRGRSREDVMGLFRIACVQGDQTKAGSN
jgi:hypothetical protein